MAALHSIGTLQCGEHQAAFIKGAPPFSSTNEIKDISRNFTTFPNLRFGLFFKKKWGFLGLEKMTETCHMHGMLLVQHLGVRDCFLGVGVAWLLATNLAIHPSSQHT